MVPEAFGLSASTVSRCLIRASARQLAALQTRRLDAFDLIMALMLDGKTFAEDAMVVALGITVHRDQPAARRLNGAAPEATRARWWAA